MPFISSSDIISVVSDPITFYGFLHLLLKLLLLIRNVPTHFWPTIRVHCSLMASLISVMVQEVYFDNELFEKALGRHATCTSVNNNLWEKLVTSLMLILQLTLLHFLLLILICSAVKLITLCLLCCIELFYINTKINLQHSYTIFSKFLARNPEWFLWLFQWWRLLCLHQHLDFLWNLSALQLLGMHWIFLLTQACNNQFVIYFYAWVI